MSNLFKKGFASVALASAMASGVFAGNAAYIDVKVNYLSGMGKAVLGYDETKDDNTTNKRLEEVELLVSILDKDGNYATKNANGALPIGTMILDGVAIGANSIKGDSESIDGTNNDIISDGVITRSLGKLKNVHRFVIDYSNAEVSKLMDTVTLTSGSGTGKIKRMVNINLTTREARGLVVRATPNSNFKTERYINEEFGKIEILSEKAGTFLGAESTTSPGGIAGVVVPIQVYASTVKNQDASTGRFTFASNLKEKTIVVQALADYNNNGTPSVVLNSVELKMVNGQASGEITITNAMPATAFDVTAEATHAQYGTTLTDGGGLGVAFVAYVKEKQSINNYIDTAHKIRDNTVMANYDFNVTMANLGNSSDTIQVRSGEAAELKIGMFTITAAKLSKLWSDTSEFFNVSEGIDLTTTNDDTIVNVTGHTDATKTLTVVDSYGNPATGDKNVDIVEKLDDEAATKNTKLVTLAADAGAITVNGGVTMVTVTASDSEETNNTLKIKSQKLTIDASDGVLSNVKAKDLIIRNLPLIEVTKNGGPNWLESISDVKTADEFANLSDVVLIAAAADVKKANANDFTVIIKSGIGDSKPTDQNGTFRVYIKDESGEGEFLEGTELKKYNIQLLTGSTGIIFGTKGIFRKDDDTDEPAASSTTGKDKSGDGYKRFDYTVVKGIDATFTIQIGKGVSGTTSVTAGSISNLVQIVVENFNTAAIKEEEIAIHIPVYEDKYTNAYVDVYMEDVGDTLAEIPVGSVVNFKFTGSAVSTGDKVVIDINSTGLGRKANGKTNTVGRIGVVGSDIFSNKNGKITTTLPENHIVSVVLYDANNSDGGSYTFNAGGADTNVTINGRKPVWLNLKDDDETKKLELAITDSITTLRSKKDAISKIRITLPETPTIRGTGDGSEEDKAGHFGVDLDFMYDGMFNGKNNAVKTGLIYSLFNLETNVVLLDKYNNEVTGLKEDISKDVIYTTTDGLEFKNNGSDNSWVKFKAEAAGTEQTLTVTRTKDDGEKITKTITWTNIKLNELNTKFMITTDANGPTDPNTGAFDVVNSEIVVKVIGDGHTKQSSTTLKVVHSDKTALVRFVKVNGLKTKNLYSDSLVGDTSSTGDAIQASGNYYILSSDKVGDVTITATAKGKDSKSADITGTYTITFDDIDLDKPVIDTEDVKVGNGEVTVIVKDANLDTVRTTVVINDKNGKKITDAVYTNGKFTAKVSSAGTYLILVTAFDMAGNVQLNDEGRPKSFKFTRISGAGAPTLEEEVAAMLIAKKEYTVAGTFTSHNFGADKAKNWIYTRKSDGKSFQLLGNTPSDEEVFGWKETEVKASTSNVWYMIKTGEGNFDWALANADGIAYKLKGAKANGSFDFSGRLNLNVSHKDGMLTFTAK